MADFEKWLSSVAAEDRVIAVARWAIRQRVKAVAHCLKKVEGASSSDPEAVHQLRVWSRRASAALSLFEPLLPQRRARKLKRTLRRLRRLGGEARDCDLLLQALSHDGAAPRASRLARTLSKRRKRAQRALDKARRKLVGRGKLKRQLKRVLARLGDRHAPKKRAQPTFGKWVQRQLPPLLARFLAFETAQLHQDERLHELRIAGKRLRYAVELSAAAFPALKTDGVYDQLEQLQNRLGEAMDHLASITRLEELQAQTAAEDLPYLREEIARHQLQFAAKKRAFTRSWTISRKRSLESRLRAAIRRNAT